MLPYSIKEGLAGFRRARFSSAASTSTMAVALVLIGTFAVIAFQARSVSTWLRERVGELELFLKDSDENVSQALFARASSYPGVAEAKFVSQDEAEAIFKKEFGEDAEVFFDERFLPASIKVRIEPSYTNADSLEKMVAEFASWNRVDEVVFNQPLLLKVNGNLRILTILGLSIGILVIFASIFLVANTIRLTIYARRLLIRTMKLVGATDGFIRMPFLVEGVTQGVLAGLLAAIALAGLYAALHSYIPQMSDIPINQGLMLGGIEVLVGVTLGWIGSYFSVRRFLRHVALH